MTFSSLLPHSVLSTWRRLLLAQGRRAPQHLLLQRAKRRAHRVVRDAARFSPAYRLLLAEHGLPSGRAAAQVPFTQLPVLDKHNTFGRFTLQQWAGALHSSDIADVLTSSGRGSKPFGMRIGNRRAHDAAWFDIDLGLQDAFDVDNVPTLVVNCLPMGVVFPSRATAVANVSVREDMACAVLQQMGPAFGQTIVCTDPLFVNRLLDHAAQVGVDWPALNTSFILGEEMLVEAQRSHIARRVGITLDTPGLRTVASSFGVGELGLNLLFETRETIALRRAMARDPALAHQALGCSSGQAVPALMCFNPLRCHVEVLAPGRAGFGGLCITLLDRSAVLQLPRYATGDSARLLPADAVQALCRASGVQPPWLPVVALQGRDADRVAGLPAVEDVKEALYAPPGLPPGWTGAFRLQRTSDSGLLLLLQGAGAQGGGADFADGADGANHAHDAHGAHDAWLEGLRIRLQGMCSARVSIRVVVATEFPDRPLVDYERKFLYGAVNA